MKIIREVYKKNPKLAVQIAKAFNKKIISAGVKQDVEKLVKAYALKIFSAKENAPIKTQQRLHDAFNKVYLNLKLKYVNQDIDFDSDRFWKVLKSKAEEWWNKKAARGPGSTW